MTWKISRNKKRFEFLQKQAKLQVCKDERVRQKPGKFCNFGGVSWRRIHSGFLYSFNQQKMKKSLGVNCQRWAIWRGIAHIYTYRRRHYKFVLKFFRGKTNATVVRSAIYLWLITQHLAIEIQWARGKMRSWDFLEETIYITGCTMAFLITYSKLLI